MKQAILIVEWNRPHYLRICLDSIQRCYGIEEWPIIISLDGIETRESFRHLLSRAQNEFTYSDHAGNLWHTVRSLEAAFREFDQVLFMDGDCILRKDALSSIPSDFGSQHMSLSLREGPRTIKWFCSGVFLIKKEAAKPLLEWVNERKWVGLPHPVSNVLMTDDWRHYDGVFVRYVLQHNLVTRCSSKDYYGHIGVTGEDFTGSEIEQQMLQGPEEQWLDNAIRLFREQGHPAFIPTGFRYDD